MAGTLDNKVALVTGSGRGIGRAMALKFAHAGARVVVNDLDAGPAEDLVAEIKAAGGDAVACAGSVTAPDFAERFIGTALKTYQGIDIIVNNAGYTWDNVIQKMTDEQWYAMLDCHMTAPFRILRAARIEGHDIKVGMNPDLLATMERGIPLGRAGTHEEAAGAVYLFTLPEADYISGQTLLCSGGLTGI